MDNARKLLMIAPEKCISCGTCELACSLAHEGEFRPSKSRITVYRFEMGVTIPMTCFQCDSPACVAACRTSALVKNTESGVVTINSEKCIGCRMCEMACPFGNIAYNAVTKTPMKCDLCGGDPECAKYCPTHAIEYVPADAAVSKKKYEFSAKMAAAIGEGNK
ncbi:4Fe-4S dicluster domain-containing protein [Methanogenium marinum]|uniref:4Fe-4S dicluster domain-containing protein n=1 Tax=Methanogenium marinum TaxID=348610 RepID=A0A9Q4PW45_9EURY|nr:4Fe-4S dicluster domain-containing protein [Methanogenium marinum]MDE4908695.1 4Fe-4S dicluster domain-containing protein [Methanogenium marinum]